MNNTLAKDPGTQQIDLPRSVTTSVQNADEYTYEYVRTISEGAFGEVHECGHFASGQRVAIKHFRAAHSSPQVWRLALREARVLQTLPRHPHVVRLLRAVCSQASGRVYFVFELMGGSLAQEMASHPGNALPGPLLKTVAWQLLAALAHCHKHGIVHRDVKPANVLISHTTTSKAASPRQTNPATSLSSQGQPPVPTIAAHSTHPSRSCKDDGADSKRHNGAGGSEVLVKLCDFGFARWLPQTQQRALSRSAGDEGPCGGDGERRYENGMMTDYVVTRWYRPPEVLIDAPYGTPSDIWSYGCTIAELACGQPLFPGQSSGDQLWRILRCQGPLPRSLAATTGNDLGKAAAVLPPARGRSLEARLQGVEPQLLELISACLALDPARRPTAAQLLQMPYFTGMVSTPQAHQQHACPSPPFPATPPLSANHSTISTIPRAAAPSAAAGSSSFSSYSLNPNSVDKDRQRGCLQAAGNRVLSIVKALKARMGCMSASVID